MTPHRPPRILPIGEQVETLRSAAEVAIEHGDPALGGLLRLVASATVSLGYGPEAPVSERDTEERMRWAPTFYAAVTVAREVLRRAEVADLDAIATAVRDTVRP